MKPTKCPAREKEMRQEKRKKKGGEKAKSKSQDCCVTKIFILFSAHAQTSQADILHLDQGRVVQTLDSAIHWITHYPADKY